MNKIIVMIVCSVFLTVGYVWAQEAKPISVKVPAREARIDKVQANAAQADNAEAYGAQVDRVPAEEAYTTEPWDDAANEEILNEEALVNDEGYGTEDEEYYGSEEDGVNSSMNAEEDAGELTNTDDLVDELPSNDETR